MKMFAKTFIIVITINLVKIIVTISQYTDVVVACMNNTNLCIVVFT